LLFTIRHLTVYRSSRPVRLGPQLLRFQPRDDGGQRVLAHHLRISPPPVGRNDHLELEGNRATQVWFEGETDRFEVEAQMQVATSRQSAYDFLLTPEARSMPMPHSLHSSSARAYLERTDADAEVTAFAAGLSRDVERDTLGFLARLNGRLFSDFTRVIRDTGSPQAPVDTLSRRRGACRDLSVLFVDCCRAEGIPARFVSGYQKGDRQRERRYLHAWPEVYLPGAGWCGFDPTHGEAVTDAHVAIAAAAHPGNTMPITGTFLGDGVTNTLDFSLDILAEES